MLLPTPPVGTEDRTTVTLEELTHVVDMTYTSFQIHRDTMGVLVSKALLYTYINFDSIAENYAKTATAIQVNTIKQELGLKMKFIRESLPDPNFDILSQAGMIHELSVKLSYPLLNRVHRVLTETRDARVSLQEFRTKISSPSVNKSELINRFQCEIGNYTIGFLGEKARNEVRAKLFKFLVDHFDTLDLLYPIPARAGFDNKGYKYIIMSNYTISQSIERDPTVAAKYRVTADWGISPFMWKLIERFSFPELKDALGRIGFYQR